MLKRTSGEYGLTHDHTARTTTVYFHLRDHVIRTFPALPGILTRRKALEALGVTDKTRLPSKPTVAANPVFFRSGK